MADGGGGRETWLVLKETHSRIIHCTGMIAISGVKRKNSTVLHFMQQYPFASLLAFPVTFLPQRKCRESFVVVWGGFFFVFGGGMNTSMLLQGDKVPLGWKRK